MGTRRVSYWPRPRVTIQIDADYPDYAVLEIGSAYVPVMLTGTLVADCFTSGEGTVTARHDEDAAWAMIAEDARAMGRAPQREGEQAEQAEQVQQVAEHDVPATPMRDEEAAAQMVQARLETLRTGLRAALVVLREWINRVQIVDGHPVVDIEDVEGVRKLYQTLLRAYGEEQP